MHYYQFNIADYRKDTAHLKPIEHYIYRTLIDWYYLDETPIPKETQMVMRRLCLGTQEEPSLLNVLLDFFILTDSGWTHKRIEQDIVEYATKCEKNANNGKLGGRPKKTQSVIFANPNESESNPNQEPLTINHKPVLKEKNNKKEKTDPIREELSEVTDQTFADFIQLRKAKKAPLTIRAIQSIKTEASKAGISLETALIECCSRGWQSFKSDWFHNSQAPPAHQSKQQLASVAARSIFGPDSRNEKLIEGEIVRYECITG